MNDANSTIATWRNDASDSNPAGPLFIGGEFAQADIVCESDSFTNVSSVCTGCGTIACC